MSMLSTRWKHPNTLLSHRTGLVVMHEKRELFSFVTSCVWLLRITVALDHGWVVHVFSFAWDEEASSSASVDCVLCSRCR